MLGTKRRLFWESCPRLWTSGFDLSETTMTKSHVWEFHLPAKWLRQSRALSQRNATSSSSLRMCRAKRCHIWFQVMATVAGNWWRTKPECVISATSICSSHREEHLCSSAPTLNSCFSHWSHMLNPFSQCCIQSTLTLTAAALVASSLPSRFIFASI